MCQACSSTVCWGTVVAEGKGASDPDDMAIVYGIESDDGERGIVVDAYGVYADPRLGEFLKNVKIREEQ